VVFHFTLPKETQPNGLSFYIAKRDTTQWSFLLLCQRGRSPVVFPFTLPKRTQPSGLSFYFPCTCFHMRYVLCLHPISKLKLNNVHPNISWQHISYFFTHFYQHIHHITFLNSHVLKLNFT
jgi:hypothetical protein